MHFTKTSCIKIPSSLSDQDWCQSILDDLTRSSESYEDPTIIKTIKFYDDRDGNILIPRYYDISSFGHSSLDYLRDGENINFQFKRSWRNKLQEHGFNFLVENNNGILKLPPGEGKTVIAIGAVCKIGKKCIIFVHKNQLIGQWKDRFIEHSSVTEDDIGILKTDKCKEILQKPIILSTVQTMSSMINRLPDIEKILYDANIGLSIWDECHTTTGAPQYSKTAMYMPSKRVFGLSATPGRADQNHDIIWKHLGRVYSPDGETNTIAPKIIMLYFSGGTKYAEKYIFWGIPDGNGKTKLKYPKFDMPRYLSILKSQKNKKYIPTMKKICKKIYESDRITLLISDRIKVLDKIAKAIPKQDVGFYIPRSGNEQDSELLKKFVLSTPGSSRDGTDRPELDCLVMANNISNVEQAIGRVCRFLPDKKQPMVFDFVDTDHEKLIQYSEYRKKFYEEKGWEIEEKFLK